MQFTKHSFKATKKHSLAKAVIYRDNDWNEAETLWSEYIADNKLKLYVRCPICTYLYFKRVGRSICVLCPLSSKAYGNGTCDQHTDGYAFIGKREVLYTKIIETLQKWTLTELKARMEVM